MYMNFEYYAPTRVVFGVDAELQTAQLIRRAGGTRVLIVCGGGSAVRSGLLGRIEAALKEQELPFTLLGGVVPNPHLNKVYEGIALGKQIQADFILAVGGGSVIDTAKAIAYGCADDRDVWELFTHRAQAERCLPVGVVLTIAAAGSEMSSGCVITNEKTGEKRAYDDDLCRPAFAVMDPALTLTLPEYQTSSGIADILMHMMERYFNQSENMAVTDAVSEALMRTVMRYARVLMHDPQDLKARAEIMWAGSLAHNGLTGCATGGGLRVCRADRAGVWLAGAGDGRSGGHRAGRCDAGAGHSGGAAAAVGLQFRCVPLLYRSADRAAGSRGELRLEHPVGGAWRAGGDRRLPVRCPAVHAEGSARLTANFFCSALLS